MALITLSAISACTPAMNAAVQTLQSAITPDRTAENVRLNPAFRYLRVAINGRIVFLALGNVEVNPNGPIEVWYSAEKEVVRLQNGRIVGAVGMKTEWRSVSLSAIPSWVVAAKAVQPITIIRVRDVMPGYRYGVRDELSLRNISPPKVTEVKAIDPRTLVWFEENVQSPRRSRVAALFADSSELKELPPARYAVDLKSKQDTVVYGEQCLAPDFCFTWQRWSASIQNKPG